MRDFDPVKLGGHEADAWVAYYQRRWAAFLRAAVGMVRVGFQMSWPRSLRGAWWVLRANQAWAPYPENDPDRARALMRAFYAEVARTSRAAFDVDRAAELEIGWWAAHRAVQQGGIAPLVDALVALYAHVYGVPAAAVRPAAELRADAMVISDAWVAAGCDPGSDAIRAERLELIKGYALLRAAV
jgi:hypothetical protein